MKSGAYSRHRFNRRGVVIPDERRMSDWYGSDDYRTGHPIFAERHSSPARREFRAQSAASRANRSIPTK